MTRQPAVVTYGSVGSAIVALVIALSGTFGFLRRPRLKLRHDPDRVREDLVPGAGGDDWWWRVRVVAAKRTWGLFVPRTAQGVEVFVTDLRRTKGAHNAIVDPEHADIPVISGRQLPWTITDDGGDFQGRAPARIAAGTFKYLTVIGPRRGGDSEGREPDAYYALRALPKTTPGRYDLDERPGTWVAELVVSADDVPARRWKMIINVNAVAPEDARSRDDVRIQVKRRFLMGPSAALR